MAGWSAGHWLDIWQPRRDLGTLGSHTAGTTYLRQYLPAESTQSTGTALPMLLVSTDCTSRRWRASPNEINASPIVRPAAPAGVAGDGCCVTSPNGLMPLGGAIAKISGAGCCGIEGLLDAHDGRSGGSGLR